MTQQPQRRELTELEKAKEDRWMGLIPLGLGPPKAGKRESLRVMQAPFSVATLAVFLLATSAAAQVVVMTNANTGAFVIVTNQANAPEAAKRKAEAKGGEGWEVALVSTAPGYGSMFCVSELKKGLPMKAFIAEGEDTSKAAIEKSRAKAREYGKTVKSSPYWCGNWKNENKFPLPPK